MGIRINFNKLGHQIQQGFEHLPQEIAHVPQQIQQQTGIDPHAIQDWIHHEVDQVLQAGAKEVAEVAFKESAKAARALYGGMQKLRDSKPDLATAIDGVSVQVTLSVLTMTYDGFMHRAEGLCNLLEAQSKNFAFTRQSVRWIIENTGPTAISLNVEGELFTSALSAGIQIDAPLALAVELIDMALEAAGVSES